MVWMQGAIEAEEYKIIIVLECKVQLKQKDIYNCSCLCIIHSEPKDASRIFWFDYFGITFTVAVAITFIYKFKGLCRLAH